MIRLIRIFHFLYWTYKKRLDFTISNDFQCSKDFVGLKRPKGTCSDLCYDINGLGNYIGRASSLVFFFEILYIF